MPLSSSASSSERVTYILDTHPLVWFLEANPRLPERIRSILADPAETFVIPSIVLAEMWYLHHRKRIRTAPGEVRTRLHSAENCSVYPLDQVVLDLLPEGLEIHDAIIVATARLYGEVLHHNVRLVTCDRAIGKTGVVETAW